MEEDKLNKAIDLLKSEVKIYDQYYCLATSQALKIVLNELDRLKKENEELKDRNKYLVKDRVELEDKLYESNENYISKQVIKDIFEVKIYNYNYLSETDWSGQVKYIDKCVADVLQNILQEILEKEKENG